ncbi:MAG: thioredoxin peroxidase [Ilumatobacteraceae bacterium]|jgi:peroxiredoxin|nr:thioredoxin peroxidase [Ilumatobacteraceae bacterium]
MPVEMSRPLVPGEPAPAFALPKNPSEVFSSRELHGRPALLAFYPADWSPVCGDQLALYQAILPEFEQYDAQIVGISVDGAWCHAAYADARGLTFPLLADFEPKGEVSRTFGVYRHRDGISERALFVLDEEGVIRWQQVVAPEVNPGAAGILSALDDLHATSEVRGRVP